MKERLDHLIQIKLLPFLTFFDNYCFSVQFISLRPSVALKRAERVPLEKENIMVLKSLELDTLMEIIEALEDATDGIWAATGALPHSAHVFLHPSDDVPLPQRLQAFRSDQSEASEGH